MRPPRSGRWLALAIGCLFAATPVAARQLTSGSLPLKITSSASLVLADDDEIRIEGNVEAAANVTIVLRFDDATSRDYASRFNGERVLPPGPFRWTIATRALRTPNGRLLDPSSLQRMIFFHAAGRGRVSVHRMEVARSRRLPEGSVGHALGGETSELPAGFERITAHDPRITGANITEVRRPAPDPLVASGLRGVERLRLAWSGGRVRVTLWTEDPGQWETLPHPLERRIRVNGVDALAEHVTPSQWIDRRYLRGIDAEHTVHDDAWTAYGRHRGAPVTVEVDPTADGGVTIELAGSGPEALFLSAVLLEPAGTDAASRRVEAMRAEWYRSNWPIDAAASRPAVAPAPIALGQPDPPPLSAFAAPGTGVRFAVAVTSDIDVAAPRVRLEPPRRDGEVLGADVWAAQVRLERRSAGDTVLALADNTLSGTPGRLPLAAGTPRTYELWIDVPASAPPGRYAGSFHVGGNDRDVGIPIDIEVLDVALPAAPKAAGFYLDEAPHLAWFTDSAAERTRQTACDARLMARFGLGGSAPALTTPGDGTSGFANDVRIAAASGLVAPWFAYAPAKRLLQRHGIAGSAERMARVERELQASGIAPPLWSLADEPSNPDQDGPGLEPWIAAIRATVPGARIAAQLNSPADRRLIRHFDTVLLNDGYGLDLASLADAAAFGREVWIYNSTNFRLASGLWLWHSPAKRYLQWHARMPTADPLDPTDGREGDVQAIFPSRETCPPVPTIHRGLLDMADGIVDQRWLAWLAAQTGDLARRRSREIAAAVGASWRRAAALSPGELQRIRESIIEVYRTLERGPR